MSAVEVLAILDDLIVHSALRVGERQALQDSRDAVAELIEAADGVDATHGPMLNGPVDPKVQQIALDRLRTALARVGGAA